MFQGWMVVCFVCFGNGGSNKGGAEVQDVKASYFRFGSKTGECREGAVGTVRFRVWESGHSGCGKLVAVAGVAFRGDGGCGRWLEECCATGVCDGCVTRGTWDVFCD
jgi:hypothetical protein